MAYGTVSADVIQSSVANTSLGAGNASIMKNRIINGAMVIDQRNAGASITPLTSGSWYATDRFQYILTQSSKFTSQQSSTAPTGFNNSVLITSSSAYSVTSTDAFLLRQIVEGYNFADCNWGTANAKTVTLSFWVQSSLTGTFGGSLANSDSSRSYPFTYTISSANTWEQKTITVAGDTTGTWVGATNGRGVIVNFGLGIGSTYLGTAGAWVTGNYSSATGATSVVGTNGATFYITGVQLEVGSSATGYEYRMYGQELALCQRYYEKAYDYDVKVPPTSSTYAWFTPTNTSAIGNTALHTTIKYSVAKRARPTVTVYPFTTPSNTTRVSDAHNNSDFGANSGAVYIGRVNQCCLYNDSGSSLVLAGGEYGLNFGWSADAEL